MLKLFGKPILEYSLRSALETKIDEIIVVVGHAAEDIMNTYGNTYKGKPIKYVIQPFQKGVVHAIESANKAIDGDDFMLLMGDEVLLNNRHQLMVEEFEREKLFGICGVHLEKRKERIKKTYAILQDDQHKILRLTEKPRKPWNHWMGTGNCVFRNDIFSYVDRTPVNSVRGEKELPDWIQCAIDEGKEVKSFVVCDSYFNINSELDLKEAEKALSKRTQLGYTQYVQA